MTTQTKQLFDQISVLPKDEQYQIAKSITSAIVKNDLLYELDRALHHKVNTADFPSEEELSNVADQILDNSFLREIACPRLSNYKDCPASYQNDYFNTLIKKAEEYAETYEQYIKEQTEKEERE